MITRYMALLAFLALLGLAGPLRALEPGEALSDPALETRARDISKELRCLVCQNQSIDDSNAALARDLRLLVRERLKAGDSDPEVIAFIVERYGAYVRLRPPVDPTTYALWFGPASVLAIALFVVFRATRRPRPNSSPLDADERRRIDALRDGSP
jgi:cytochrome c-type biogenesis protein CcmH